MVTSGQFTAAGNFADQSTTQTSRLIHDAQYERRPVPSIDCLGRHLLLVGLTPVGVFGIAVGATTVILELANSTIHLPGIAIIWGAATMVGMLAIIVGTREAITLASRPVVLADPSNMTNDSSTTRSSSSGEWPNPSIRYPSLKSVNPQT